MRHKILSSLALDRYTPGDRELPQTVAVLWRKLADEGKLGAFFPSCDCANGWDHRAWMDQIRSDRNHVLVCRDGIYPLGFVLLAGVRPRRAFFHFAWFNAVGLQIVAASKWVCNSILQLYDLDVLIGMIPETNGQAIRLAELTGFEFCGFFPSGSYVRLLQKSVTTQVYCYTNNSPANHTGRIEL